MSINFYTVTYKGKEYIFDYGIYGVGRVAKSLGIPAEMIKRGAAAGKPAFTNAILAEIKAEQAAKAAPPIA